MQRQDSRSTFLLTCVPTEGDFNCCVPVFFGVVGFRGGAILCVPCCADLASLCKFMADTTLRVCDCLGEEKVCACSLRPADDFWSRGLCPKPVCMRHEISSFRRMQAAQAVDGNYCVEEVSSSPKGHPSGLCDHSSDLPPLPACSQSMPFGAQEGFDDRSDIYMTIRRSEVVSEIRRKLSKSRYLGCHLAAYRMLRMCEASSAALFHASEHLSLLSHSFLTEQYQKDRTALCLLVAEGIDSLLIVQSSSVQTQTCCAVSHKQQARFLAGRTHAHLQDVGGHQWQQMHRL